MNFASSFTPLCRYAYVCGKDALGLHQRIGWFHSLCVIFVLYCQVLNETRPLVERYNELLQTHICALKHPNIVFLKDVFDNLLTESTGLAGDSPAAEVKAVAAGDGTFLKGSTRRMKPEFKLDGTHLHPKYVETLLAPAITKALA